MLKQKPDQSVVKVNRYLKKENVKAVPFDKGAGFCLLTSEQYGERLTDILRGPQFLELPRQKEEPLIKSEKALNAKMMTLYKQKISKEHYESMRSVGAQPARLYGLAKVQKDGTPLRAVLSLPGSCYQNLTRVLYSYCKDIDEGRIQTSSQKLKEKLMGTTLDDDECLISLDVKNLYTNVPVDEAIELVTKLAYDGLEPPPFDRAVFQKLLHLALTNVLFKCCGRWYRQTEGLTMGSSLSVVLANIWMNTFEDTLARV